MPRALVPLSLLALLLAAGCPRPSAPDAPGDDPAQVPAGAVDPGVEPGADGAKTPAEGCLSDADCDGGVCEGQGCGDDEPGTCAPPDRMCTRDSVPYCGCDGQTFRSSGSCPGRRYASQGECTGEPAAN